MIFNKRRLFIWNFGLIGHLLVILKKKVTIPPSEAFASLMPTLSSNGVVGWHASIASTY